MQYLLVFKVAFTFTIEIYTINNNRMLSSIELSEFLMYNVSEILKYYEEFKEEQSYEYERNSKGNMAK